MTEVSQKILLNIFERFPEFNCSKKMYLFEISDRLKNLQKKKITNKKVKWIKNFNKIKNGPVIFFGNEFFDAIPIQQFKKNKGKLYKKYFSIQEQGKIKEIFKKASKREASNILNYKSLKNLKFIEFPKNGLKEIKRMIKKILQLKGCLLLIDYGYIKPNNQNTLQSVMRHKKNNFLKNLGNADITSHVNFKLLDEFFKKNKLKTKSIISQQKFLKKMGIIERAEIIAKKMKFKEQSNLYLRLSRLLNSNLMGEMFKVILAYKSESDNFFGFE